MDPLIGCGFGIAERIDTVDIKGRKAQGKMKVPSLYFTEVFDDLGCRFLFSRDKSCKRAEQF